MKKDGEVIIKTGFLELEISLGLLYLRIGMVGEMCWARETGFTVSRPARHSCRARV